MVKKVMICCDYERDLWRVNRCLNTWNSKLDLELTGIVDQAAWSNVKLRGTYGVNRWVGDEVYGTIATVVFVGSQTSKQPHVIHAIQLTAKSGNGLVLIDLHNIKDQDLKLGSKGPNPVEPAGVAAQLAGKCVHYDWVESDGASNLDTWISRVARKS